MIHTIQFATSKYIRPIVTDLRVIKSKFRPIKDIVNNTFKYIGTYENLKFEYNRKYNLLFTRVNLNELLNKDNITTTDYHLANNLINKQFEDIFKDTWIGNLNRIDYKTDIYIQNKDTYIKVLKKGSSNYRALKQNKTYDTSIYYNSKSTHINIYDKYEQLLSKDHNTIVDVDKYKDMLRFEVQLLNPKLRYIQNHEGICRELINYFSETDRDYYMNEELKRIIYNGDYYNTYNSNKILLERYTKSMTDKLITLQKNISIGGITKAKEKYNQATFNTYINKLQDAGVNPIPIPKNEGIGKLNNFFKFTNENIYLLDNYKLKDAV